MPWKYFVWGPLNLMECGLQQPEDGPISFEKADDQQRTFLQGGTSPRWRREAACSGLGWGSWWGAIDVCCVEVSTYGRGRASAVRADRMGRRAKRPSCPKHQESSPSERRHPPSYHLCTQHAENPISSQDRETDRCTTSNHSHGSLQRRQRGTSMSTVHACGEFSRWSSRRTRLALNPQICRSDFSTSPRSSFLRVSPH
ncbi:hypothetical protein BV20DRAFT_740290 [Pilatotrama ljubarskyi]|nr:hypothetical protein BV20DRAFT_740290 [Pilatotrama ljubarskyi]